MAKFLFLQRGGGCNDPSQMSADEMDALMKSCMEWMQAGKDEGWLLDPGAPLSGGAAVVDKSLAVTDGPFAEARELVGGYTMIEAADLATACELAKRTIKMTGAGTIEVREIAEMGS